MRFHRPNFDVAVNLSDSRQVVDRLSTLVDKVQKKAATKSARTAMQIVRKAAIRNAMQLDDPKTPERIWRNIVVQAAPRLGKRNGGVAMRVGVRGGARQYGNTRENRRKGRVGATYATAGDKTNPGGDTWYWRLVEFGTAKTRARPFLTPALSANVQTVTDAVIGNMGKEIDKILAENGGTRR